MVHGLKQAEAAPHLCIDEIKTLPDISCFEIYLAKPQRNIVLISLLFWTFLLALNFFLQTCSAEVALHVITNIQGLKKSSHTVLVLKMEQNFK